MKDVFPDVPSSLLHPRSEAFLVVIIKIALQEVLQKTLFHMGRLPQQLFLKLPAFNG